MAKSAKYKAELVQNQQNPDETNENIPDIEKIRTQIGLINKGMIVHISRVTQAHNDDDHYVIHVTVMSEVTGMPVFGDLKLRMPLQTAAQLKNELARAL